jgi:DNA-binding PadR family transcriptional regulator
VAGSPLYAGRFIPAGRPARLPRVASGTPPSARSAGEEDELPTLGYAILSALARDDLTGYDITARLRRPISYYWQAAHSQIYPMLAGLEGAGLVTHAAVPGGGRRTKKRYRITRAGLERLARWVVTPPPPRVPRDELVLKTYSLWLADPAMAAELFRAQARHHRRTLTQWESELEALRERYGAELDRSTSQVFATYATLRRGVGAEREYVAWCTWVADRCDSHGSTPP